jgi:colicin import membrane protein
VQRIIESNLEAIRVQEKFGGDSGRAQAADNLLRINDEFERVELKIREARQAGDQATVDALASRLAVLDQVAARESDIATGALAKRQEEAKAAADAVAQREKLEVEARQKRLQAEQEAARQVAAERQRVNQIVDQQLALQSVGGDQSRLTAAQNLAALEQEILRINQDIANAKTLGDEAAIQAGQQRLAAVNEIAKKERDVANGKAAEREREREHFEKLAQQQQKARDEQQRQAEQLAQRQQQEQQQALQAQRKAFEERAKAQQAEFNRQAEITRQLNSVGQQSIGGGDIRSSQGAQAFLRTAANAFDPRAAEQLRLQREQLKLMRALAERLVPEALGYLQQGLTTTVSFLGNTP